MTFLMTTTLSLASNMAKFPITLGSMSGSFLLQHPHSSSPSYSPHKTEDKLCHVSKQLLQKVMTSPSSPGIFHKRNNQFFNVSWTIVLESQHFLKKDREWHQNCAKKFLPLGVLSMDLSHTEVSFEKLTSRKLSSKLVSLWTISSWTCFSSVILWWSFCWSEAWFKSSTTCKWSNDSCGGCRLIKTHCCHVTLWM